MWRSSECHPHTHSDEDNGRLDGTRGDQEESEDFFFILKMETEKEGGTGSGVERPWEQMEKENKINGH